VSEEPIVLPGVRAQHIAEVVRLVDQAVIAAEELGASFRQQSQAMDGIRDAFAAALRRRVEQRAAQEQPPAMSLAGHLCEQCLDAPAVRLMPAPWGGEMGVCGECAPTEEGAA
jgi:hypothetical protein